MWFYSLLFPIAFLLSAPYYFARLRRRGGWKKGFGQRYALYDKGVRQQTAAGRVIWFHAVSVGEVGVFLELFKQLERALGDWKIVVSTTTTTGMAQLAKKAPGHVTKIYFPLDSVGIMRKAFQILRPRMVVLVEAEFWPNFMRQCQKRRVPMFLVNARISERSFKGYRRFGFLFRRFFQAFEGVGAQSEKDRERLLSLGFRSEALQVTGSLKFDGALSGETMDFDIARVFESLGVSGEQPVLLAASTHMGEEALVAKVFLKLKQTYPDLFLVIAPRHFERGAAVGNELSELGLDFVFRSEMGADFRLGSRKVEALLLNTTGELKSFYRRSCITFVGKSLLAKGGQNPIEPAAMANAVLFGPSMNNFKEIVAQFLSERGAIQVGNADELETVIASLLEVPRELEAMGQRARAVVDRNRGAVQRTCEMLTTKLGDCEY